MMGTRVGIVERAAARLGSVPRSDARPQARGDAIHPETPADLDASTQLHRPNLIERTIASAPTHGEAAGGQDRLAADRLLLAQAHGSRNAAPVVNPRMLNIDSAWLRAHNMITPDAERTPIAEDFRRIKRNILKNVNDRAGKAATGEATNLVMMTSALPNEGKTFCSINLAMSLALEVDHTVLLVDADTIRPNVLPSLGLKPGLPGLMDVLSGKVGVGDVLQRTNIDKLSILPAGTPNRRSTEMLGSDLMRSLVRELSERYEDRIVLFDSAPLLLASEASVLATHMSLVMVVAAAEQTAQAALKDALRRLEGCKLVGLMLNKGQHPGSSYGYGGYGYGYG